VLDGPAYLLAPDEPDEIGAFELPNVVARDREAGVKFGRKLPGTRDPVVQQPEDLDPQRVRVRLRDRGIRYVDGFRQLISFPRPTFITATRSLGGR
jgi:hypothetical protein